MLEVGALGRCIGGVVVARVQAKCGEVESDLSAI